MLQRVSNQGQRLLTENGDRFERESMNKTAMDSFSKVIVASAKTLIAKGETVADVAEKLKLKVEFLKELLKTAASMEKLACACDQEEERLPEMKSDLKKKAANDGNNRELTEEELDAMEAYNSLHNIKASYKPSLPNASSKRILSNKGDDVQDTGGAPKQMGYERNNSIFDPNVISRQAKIQTNDEILREQNAQISKDRVEAKRASRYETIDGHSIVDALKGVDQRKDNGIRASAAAEAHKYDKKLPSNGISIFDTNDFDRIPENTAGEKRRADIKEAAAKPKDRSWVESGAKSITSTDIVDKFINSMMGDKNKKG